MTNKEQYERIIERERLARKEAERIMEDKSRELYEANQRLSSLNTNLEKEVSKRTLKIQESEAQLSVLFDEHPFPIIVFQLSGLEILAVNKTAIQKYKYTHKEFLQKTILDLHAENEIEFLTKNVPLIKKEVNALTEWVHVAADGEEFNVVTSGSSITYKNKEARLVVVEDVTEKKKLEKERDAQHRKYQDLIVSSSDIIFRINTMGIFTFVNPAGIKLSGYSSEELLKMSFVDLVTPKYKQQVISFYQFQMENNVETTYTEFPVLTKDGTEIWLGQNVESSGYSTNEGLIFNATARDITERKKLEKALLRSEDKYRSIIENMELGLLEVDPDGNIIKAYPRFCELTGYNQGELEGRKGADFLLDKQGREFYEKQLADRITGKSNVYEIQLIKKDKSKIWVLVSGAPFYDEYNRIKGSFGIHLDITERKALESELKTAKNKAEDSLKSRELFMANISHEIRTPLNAIIGITELMNLAATDSESIKQLNHINQAGKGLLSLINELLLLSKMDMHKEKLDIKRTNLHSLIQQSFELFENQVANKPINYTAEVNINYEAYYWLDPLKLKQVIQNVLSNAIKFTHEGEIKLDVQTLNSSYDNDVIQFTISDTGIGIPKENLESIFENFEQANNNESGSFGGTGLGLPIVRNILELMGGKINVVSAGGITSFEFFLKFKRAPDGSQSSIQTSSESLKSLAGIKVLVAEDNQVNQFLIEGYLKHLNVDFDIVSNGQEAVDFVNKNNVDIVFMDMRMPVMDGIMATKAIREQRTDKLPIVALTANAYASHKEECENAGMTDFLAKPFNLSQLHSAILRSMNMDTASETDQIASEEFHHEMSDDFQLRLNRIFIDDSEIRIVELKNALQSKDYLKVKDICHSIKPSLRHLGEDRMVELTDNIEFGNDNLSINTNMLINELDLLVNQLKSGHPDFSD